MSETSYSIERKLSGTTRLLLGFVAGALFALAPMYYFYMGREAALREGNPQHDQPLTAPPEQRRAHGEQPFASRMTYELSRLPEEPLPVVAKAPAAAVVAEAESTPGPRSTPVRPAEPQPAPRIVDARPISALPPDPRDRTAAIEREAHKAQYRDPARREGSAPTAPRTFEGREIEVGAPKLPDTPTRPIIADASIDTRAEIAAERARSAAGSRAQAVAPIAPGREKSPRQVLLANAQAAEARAAAESGASRGSAGAQPAGGSVERRLAATREWLADAAQTTHTIQLMGASSEEQLEAQLKTLSKVLEDGSIRVFRTRAQGKPSITVLYGAYDDRRSALQALEKLPPAVAANRPVLRTVNGIRTEMKQHKTGG